MKLLLAVLLGLGLAGDTRQEWLVGEPSWLAAEGCSFPPGMVETCALEAANKAQLRQGPVPVPR